VNTLVATHSLINTYQTTCAGDTTHNAHKALDRTEDLQHLHAHLFCAHLLGLELLTDDALGAGWSHSVAACVSADLGLCRL